MVSKVNKSIWYPEVPEEMSREWAVLDNDIDIGTFFGRCPAGVLLDQHTKLWYWWIEDEEDRPIRNGWAFSRQLGMHAITKWFRMRFPSAN